MKKTEMNNRLMKRDLRQVLAAGKVMPVRQIHTGCGARWKRSLRGWRWIWWISINEINGRYP